MPITLQSTISFSGEFMRKLPMLEQTMIAHGLDPSGFVISKDRAAPPSIPFIGPFFFDYTVFVNGESFTLTEPNDMVFLEHFLKLCTAEDEEDRPLPKLRRERRAGPIRRFLDWMTQPV